MQTKTWLQRNLSASIEIRQYQIEAWEALWQARIQGQRKGLIHLATGLGKTSVAAVDVSHYQKEERPGSRALFVVHMTDIAEQARSTFNRVYPDFTTARYRSGKTLKNVDVIFTTFQSLLRNLDTIPSDYFDYIVWDEAHHIEAITFARVRDHFTPRFELGLTATPERADQVDITDYFGKALYTKSLSDGIAEGWLSTVDYHIIFDDAIKDAMNDGFKVETLKQLRELFSIKVRNEVIARNVREWRHKIGVDTAKTIVFCHNTIAAEEMAILLGGVAYHSGIDTAKRADILANFRDGTLQIICTVDMFNEGVDIPDAKVVVFLRSTSSSTIFEQQLGRGLRKHPGKKEVVVLDFVANVERINFVRELSTNIGIRNHELRPGRLREVQSTGVSFEQSMFTHSQFEFDDKVVEILDKYQSLKLSYLPEDRITIEQLAKKMGSNINFNALRAFVKRQATTEQYDYYLKPEDGRKVLGFTQDQAARLIDAFQNRRLQVSNTDVYVASYLELQSAVKAAKHHGVSTTTIYKALRKAGVDRIGYSQTKISDSALISMYQKVGSYQETARQLSLHYSTVQERLSKLGYKRASPVVQKISDNTLINTYKDCNYSMRKTAEKLGVDRSQVNKQLTKLGKIKKRPSINDFSRAELKQLYEKHKTIRAMRKAMKVGFENISNALKKYHYFKYDDATPVQMAAIEAYEKYGSGEAAAKELGISSVMLYKHLRAAGHTKRRYGKSKI